MFTYERTVNRIQGNPASDRRRRVRALYNFVTSYLSFRGPRDPGIVRSLRLESEIKIYIFWDCQMCSHPSFYVSKRPIRELKRPV